MSQRLVVVRYVNVLQEEDKCNTVSTGQKDLEFSIQIVKLKGRSRDDSGMRGSASFERVDGGAADAVGTYRGTGRLPVAVGTPGSHQPEPLYQVRVVVDLRGWMSRVKDLDAVQSGGHQLGDQRFGAAA